MVWFQCETCGEELKKPKLPNHFRQCSAYKLSCLDCGVTFDKQSVQFHTQCITEAEKYGPKGQVTVAKPQKSKPDVDINVGLSNRPPWFCSLCNSKATSQQALLLHGDGKKHRAKVRAYTAKQQPPADAIPKNNDSPHDNAKTEVLDDKIIADKEIITSNGALGKDNSSAKNGNFNAEKKRKTDTNDDCLTDKCLNGLSDEIDTEAGVEVKPNLLKKLKKAKPESDVDVAGSNAEKENETKASDASNEIVKENIKWKKLIISVLKTAPDGGLKLKKLRKLVFNSLKDAGSAVNDTDFNTVFEHKVHSSSKFTVDGKYVRLSA